jgi:predicted metal-dependent hydrolase
MSSALLEKAIAEWNRGDHYEAHETLEDYADAIEDNDREHTIALALIRIAASLHKLINDVGRSAVPGKISSALEDLEGAPDLWNRIDLARLKTELRVLLQRLEKNEAYEIPKI